MPVALNIRDDTFGRTKNAAYLSERLRELGDARIAWKLKKKFTKAVSAIRYAEEAPTHELSAYLTLLIIRDTEAYLKSLKLPKEIHDRAFAAVRNQCRTPPW